MIAPLLEAGWTFEDIGNLTRGELLATAKLLGRFRILKEGEVPRELAKEDPQMNILKLKHMEEMDKLNV